MNCLFDIDEDAFDGALEDPAPVQKAFKLGFVPPKDKIKCIAREKHVVLH